MSPNKTGSGSGGLPIDYGTESTTKANTRPLRTIRSTPQSTAGSSSLPNTRKRSLRSYGGPSKSGNDASESTGASDAKRRRVALPKTRTNMMLTGGTFGSKGTDTTYGLDKNQPTAQVWANFLADVEVPDDLDLHFVDPAYFKDSSSVIADDVLNLVQRKYADKTPIVMLPLGVMHGTDTMSDVAFALKLVGIDSLFAGAMYPSNSKHADGPGNARCLLLVAREMDNRRRRGDTTLQGQSLVVMNRKIFDSLTVRKGHTTSPDAFEAVNGPVVGTIENDEEVRIDHPPQPTPMTFNLEGVRKLPPVTTLDCGSFNSWNRKLALLKHELRFQTTSDEEDGKTNGEYKKILFVKGFGNGKIPEEYLDDLKDLAQQGVLIVRGTRVPNGVVSKQPTDDEYGFICAGALTMDKLDTLVRFAVADARRQNKPMSFEKLRDIVEQFQPAAAAGS